MIKRFLFIFICALSFRAVAQLSSSEIYLNLEKLASTKRVLYLAAHPDDENTRAISWLSMGEKATTAYLSLTRGDGGQNLIGKELGAELGILRSQELLAARSYDNASQFFTRAVDFGYSKTADESFEKWNKAEILKDVVKVIRQFKPDVIITRFPPDKRAGHGHHTASALLTIEAFDKANDADYLPNLVADTKTWKTTSVYWNSSYWWNDKIAAKAIDNPDYLIFDIGGYSTLLGQSFNEIGTIARSQHKCQGFGSITERGERIEYFEHLIGEKLKNNFFEQSNRTWESYGSNNLDEKFKKVLANFDFKNTAGNLNELVAIYAELQKLKDGYIKTEKLKACAKIIKACLGLDVNLTAKDYSYVKGENQDFELSILNRTGKKISYIGYNFDSNESKLEPVALALNKPYTEKQTLRVPISIEQPYWLQKSYTNLYNVTNVNLIGAPSTPASITGEIYIEINNVSVAIPVSGEYVWGDPAHGERRRAIIATPKMSLNPTLSSIISKVNVPTTFKVKLHNFSDSLQEKVKLNIPKGWKSSVESIEFESYRKHEERFYEITLTPTENAENGSLTFENSKGKAIHYIHKIEYDHVPYQNYFSATEINLVALDANIVKGKVLYIQGIEEKVPDAIAQLGFDLKVVPVADLAFVNFKEYMSVVVGIRAYNVFPELINFQPKLLNFVEDGGNLVLQYNTATRSVSAMDLGPYPFEISRDRVTDEFAQPTYLNGSHAILNYPNQISDKDFENWVQERGLYFPDSWDEKYTALLSWNDKDEDPVNGAIITTDYGKGRFTYTGISFFRELPAGVEGAYRLFANILSYEGE